MMAVYAQHEAFDSSQILHTAIVCRPCQTIVHLYSNCLEKDQFHFTTLPFSVTVIRMTGFLLFFFCSLRPL